MPSTTNWEDSEFLMDLGVALYSAAQAANGLTPNIKEAVEAYLKERGHATTWEAVRPFSAPPSPKLPLPSSSSPLCQILQKTLLPSRDPIMAKRETMKWDAQVHEDILMCMFQRLKLSNQDWTSVMEELHGMGYSFTEGALRYELLWS
ncbi:hypothetical protein ACJZ2D_001569 [Fusarium nematophilum]